MGLVWLENCREENYILLPPTKQCKNAADGGPGRIYVDGIFSRLIQGILMSTRLDLKEMTIEKKSGVEKLNPPFIYW